jgi:hypothetical protein
MEKVPCENCSNLILPTTAADNGGLCVPCSRGQITFCKVCGARAFKTMRGVELDDLCNKCRVTEAKARPTQIDAFIESHGHGDCSLLRRLFELDELLRRDGLDNLGGFRLIDPPKHYGTEATPKNSISFAETGGDWVHFSLVSVRGRVSDDSPVVLAYPATSEGHWEANAIVGETLHEFLCLGCRWGFSPIENLTIDWEGSIDELTHGPEPEDLYEDEVQTLEIYRRKLNLEPWPVVEERLRQLQDRKRFLLKFPFFRLPWKRA